MKGALMMENLTFTPSGDYLEPNMVLTLNEEENLKPLGRFGMQREKYLREHRSGYFNVLLIKGQLKSHLLNVDDQAARMKEYLMAQYLMQYPAPLQGTLEWVQHMNHLRDMAYEAIQNELVYS
jgi:hypothetical protein